MSTNDEFAWIDELDDNDAFCGQVNKQKRRITKAPKKASAADQILLVQRDTLHQFEFTYKAARFEAGWLMDSLGELYEHQWIADVLRKVKAGKEASVYLCKSGPAVSAPYAAAKVYRPRMLRNLKNDAQYREGRVDLDDEGHQVIGDNEVHAIRKRTSFGEELRHQSWIAYEFTTLEALHAAGADVPEPYELQHNAILMGYLGDLDGCAPALNEVSLERDEARELFERVKRNLDILLACDRVHGDLSAYNILYWEGAITLIDFPQVVSPKENRNAFAIFQRDVRRVCEYFARQEVSEDPRALARDLWNRHGLRIAPEVHPRLLDPEDESDRRLWSNQR